MTSRRDKDSHMEASGLPQHIVHACELRDLKDSLSNLTDVTRHLSELLARVPQAVAQHLRDEELIAKAPGEPTDRPSQKADQDVQAMLDTMADRIASNIQDHLQQAFIEGVKQTFPSRVPLNTSRDSASRKHSPPGAALRKVHDGGEGEREDDMSDDGGPEAAEDPKVNGEDPYDSFEWGGKDLPAALYMMVTMSPPTHTISIENLDRSERFNRRLPRDFQFPK